MIYVALALILVIIFFTMYKSGHFFRCIFASLFQGLSAFFAVNFIGGFINLHIPLNIFSICTSVTAGIPGVIVLVVCDTVSKLIL